MINWTKEIERYLLQYKTANYTEEKQAQIDYLKNFTLR
jgi:hypothetical protein